MTLYDNVRALFTQDSPTDRVAAAEAKLKELRESRESISTALMAAESEADASAASVLLAGGDPGSQAEPKTVVSLRKQVRAYDAAIRSMTAHLPVLMKEVDALAVKDLDGRRLELASRLLLMRSQHAALIQLAESKAKDFQSMQLDLTEIVNRLRGLGHVGSHDDLVVNQPALRQRIHEAVEKALEGVRLPSTAVHALEPLRTGPTDAEVATVQNKSDWIAALHRGAESMLAKADWTGAERITAHRLAWELQACGVDAADRDLRGLVHRCGFQGQYGPGGERIRLTTDRKALATAIGFQGELP